MIAGASTVSDVAQKALSTLSQAANDNPEEVNKQNSGWMRFAPFIISVIAIVSLFFPLVSFITELTEDRIAEGYVIEEDNKTVVTGFEAIFGIKSVHI